MRDNGWMDTTTKRTPTRCAHCGRKIYYPAGDDSWAEGWCHVKSNLRHCDYSSHDLAAPALDEPDDEHSFTIERGPVDPSTRPPSPAWTGGGQRATEVQAQFEDESPEVDCAALVAAVRLELVNLWAELEGAVRMAEDGSRSGGCERLKDRIKAFSDLVGPASWEDISIPFLLSETYLRVCEEIGHPCAATAGEMAEVRARREAEVASWAR